MLRGERQIDQLHRIVFQIEELYDLKNDPEELTNLALNPQHASRVKKMRKAMLAELRRTDAGMVDNLPSVKKLNQ